MPDREAPGSASSPDSGASRLDAVERLRRQLEEIESRSRGPQGSGEPKGQWSKPVRRSGGSGRRGRQSLDADGAPSGVWRSAGGPVSDGIDDSNTSGLESVRGARQVPDDRVDPGAGDGASYSIVEVDGFDNGFDDRSRSRGTERGGRRGSRRRSESAGEKRSGAVQPGASQGGTEAQAKDICLRLLTDRARSRAELADKLAAKGFTPEIAERALNRLAEVGLIDDAAFAEQWVHSRHTFSGKGKKVLVQELRRRGVSDTDAEPALAAITPADESARAAELVRRKLATLPGDLAPEKATARLVGMLARRGFPQSMAYAVVKDELAAAAEAAPSPEETASPVGSEVTPSRRSAVVDPAADVPPRPALEPDVEQAAELVRRKLRSVPRDLPRDKTTVRLVGMLARRGYSRSMAYAVVQDVLAVVTEVVVELSPGQTSSPAGGATIRYRAGDPAADHVASDAKTRADTEPDTEQVAELVRRKIRTMPRTLSTDKVINRLVGMLARRGYSQSVAYTVVRAELAHGFPPD